MLSDTFSIALSDLRDGISPNLSPERIAANFDIGIQEIAELAGVQRNTILHNPGAPRLQMYLRDVLRVLVAASETQLPESQIYFFVKNAPLSPFDHKTALALVSEGRTDDVVKYLASITSGFVG